MAYLEQTIRILDEQKRQKDNAKYKLFSSVFLVSVIFALFSLLSIFFSLFTSTPITLGVIGLVFFAAGAAFAFFKKDSCNIEYDYIVDDNLLTVAKIKNLERRKEVLNLNFSTFKRIEPYSKERVAALQAKKLDFSLNEEDRKYVLFAEQDGQIIIIFEPNEELLGIIKRALQ